MNLAASDAYISDAIDCFYEISVRILQAVIRRLFSQGFAEHHAMNYHMAYRPITHS